MIWRWQGNQDNFQEHQYSPCFFDNPAMDFIRSDGGHCGAIWICPFLRPGWTAIKARQRAPHTKVQVAELRRNGVGQKKPCTLMHVQQAQIQQICARKYIDVPETSMSHQLTRSPARAKLHVGVEKRVKNGLCSVSVR